MFRPTKSKMGELAEINRDASDEVKKRKADIEKKLGQEEERERARQLKRKSQELADLPSKVPRLKDDESSAAAAFDYSQVDYQQMFAAKEKKSAADFNPNRAQQDKKNMKRFGGGGGGKPKQRMKGGGAGLTFNK